MEDRSPKTTLSMNTERDALKAKRKLKLAIPSEENSEKKLVPIEGTSSFLLEGQIRQTDEIKNNSSSASKAQKAFFKRNKSADFDVEGRCYYIRGRNNGKFMEDKYKVISEFKDIENCSFYGIYDGHSTDIIAELLKDNLHEYIINSYREQGSISQAYLEGKLLQEIAYERLELKLGFEKIEKEAITKLTEIKQLGGSTALCVTIVGDFVYTANLGDSRAIIVSEEGFKVLNNLHDFSNENEELAVSQRGGVIIERGATKRLCGELAISRSIGDYNYKKYISAIPEISEHQLADSNSFLLLATDGFWNVVSPEQVVSTIKLIKNEFKELYSVQKISEYLMEMACSTRQNIKKDNIILIFVDLRKLNKKNSWLEA